VVEINWSILQPVDIGGNFQTGFAMGQQLVQKAKLKSALAAYVQDPTNPQAQNALAMASPEFGMRLAGSRTQQAAAEQERKRVGGILSQYDTDPAAARRAALEGGDIDLAKQLSELDEDQRKRAVGMFKSAAPIAYRIRQTADPAQRKAIFDQARPILEAQGWPADKLDSFDVTNDTALDAVIASAQTVDQLIDQGKITWHQQGEQPSFATDAMGHPIGTQNPYASPTPSVPSASAGGFDAAVEHVLTNEGGYNASDMNGKPVNFGINQGANPDIDVKGLTREGAKQLYHDRYWVPSGAEDLPSNLQAPYFDVYIRNPAVAKRALSQSGGDPIKFMEITNGYFRHLGQTPDGQRYAKSWANRDSRNLSIATGAPHITSKADFDALPSGTEFIAPDGTHRRKP